MTRTRLILADIVFIVGVGLLAYATDWFQKTGLLMVGFMAAFAFFACVKWHVEYYKLNKKIY